MRSSAAWDEPAAMFAWQQYGVKPDIMTCAKALGCGVPVGAFVLNEKVAGGIARSPETTERPMAAIRWRAQRSQRYSICLKSSRS